MTAEIKDLQSQRDSLDRQLESCKYNDFEKIRQLEDLETRIAVLLQREFDRISGKSGSGNKFLTFDE